MMKDRFMNRIKTIKWLRDIHDEEPLSELLPDKQGLLKPHGLKWSYKKGQQIRVSELRKDSKGNCFFDVDGGHQITDIPPDAFEEVD